MKILSRYLFGNLLKPLLYLLAAFTLLFVVGDLMNTAGDFVDAKTSLQDIAYYYVLRLPSLVVMIVPLCLLLAVLYSLSSLTRHSEISAMRASGVSIYRIVAPYLLMGAACFCFTAAVNEYIGPKFNYRAEQFLKQQKQRNADVYVEQIPFNNPSANQSWYIERFDTRTFTMTGATLRQHRADGSDAVKYTAEKGRWLDGRWWFENVAVQKFDAQNNLDGPAETYAVLEMRDLPEVPEDFMGEIKDSAYQSSLELRKYIRTHHRFLSEKTLVKYEVEFQTKLAMPFICLIATIIGIPVGAHTGRKGAFAGIMTAIAMFFGFYILQFVLVYLAKQMAVPPWTGPWAPVILFSAIGAVMIWRMR